MTLEKAILAWSGGKDSAMALYELHKVGCYEISALLATVTEDYDRISMHGVRSVLVEQQAESLGLPLEKIYITKDSSNEEYEAGMRNRLMRYRNRGVLSVAFGDIFLEEVRKYREENLSKLGMRGIFPLWKRNTTELAHTFVDLGFKAITTCVDSKFLGREFVGREFDEHFLTELPSNVDPCGENGEFHSFVYDGPIFAWKIPYTKGDVVLKGNRFYFCDLIPGSLR
ncbi:MAG: diphthine--ammonia ligase [Candidatus Brockarchaeota archaeon]|nr:diphthine--ammonia ligase [Candidatus Brockarchaeota archaeon]